MSRFVTALATLLLGLAPAVAAEPRKPNIVVILADDLGYADLGCQGCKDIPTPNIDTLASNGVRCTSGYSNHPVCSPSRAGLMTGLYPQRFGFEHNSGPEKFADPKFGVPRTVPTLAEKLKSAGYATGMVGKWHIGFKEGLRPHERGFDYHFGFLSGAHAYLPGKKDNDPLVRNGKTVDDEKEYLTDAFAREAVGFIDRSKDKPFFLYLAFNAVHSPLQATNEYERRFPEIKDAKRKTYAGMLSAMDDAVGKVLGKLRDLKLEANTLVVFYSDNGGPTAETSSRNDPLRGFKGQMYEGGVRVPFLWQWKGTLPAGKVYDPAVMGLDVHGTALAAAGVETPKDKPLDGVNLLPFFTGKQTGDPHDKVFWRAGPQHAARVGDWKLVSFRGTSQLFNLKDDLGEKTDLATKQPAKFKELEGIYAAWDKQMMRPLWVRQDAKNPGPKKDEPKKVEPMKDDTIATRFKQFDTNGDGNLSADELKKAPAAIQRRLEGADKDKDGFLTLDEVRAHLGGAAPAAKQPEVAPMPKTKEDPTPNATPDTTSTAPSGSQPASAIWVTLAVRAPRVEHRTFESTAVKTKVSYHIYTPDIYDKDKDRRFPVLYWLHGSGGGLAGIKPLSEIFDEAIRKEKIPPMLIVFPNGMANSMWCDSKDGKVPMEQVVIKELLPLVDRDFRTIAKREGRLIEGFSMGGYGAARLGFNNSDLFGTVSILAGGPLDLEFKGPRATGNPKEREGILQYTFGGDIDYYKAQSPLTVAEKYSTTAKDKARVRMAVGARDFTADLNRAYSEHLKKLKITHDFTEVPGVTHDTLALLKGLGDANWEFYRKVFDGDKQ